MQLTGLRSGKRRRAATVWSGQTAIYPRRRSVTAFTRNRRRVQRTAPDIVRKLDTQLNAMLAWPEVRRRPMLAPKPTSQRCAGT
jgi:hypothetical protein